MAGTFSRWLTLTVVGRLDVSECDSRGEANCGHVLKVFITPLRARADTVSCSVVFWIWPKNVSCGFPPSPPKSPRRASRLRSCVGVRCGRLHVQSSVYASCLPFLGAYHTSSPACKWRWKTERDKSLNCFSGRVPQTRRRGDRQQSADWLGSLRRAILWARQHIYSISHIAALVSAWRRTCAGERPIFYLSAALPPPHPSLSLSLSLSLTRHGSPPLLITRPVGMQSRHHQLRTEKKKRERRGCLRFR